MYDILNHHAPRVSVLNYTVEGKGEDWHFHNLTWTLNLTLCYLIPSTAQHLKELLSPFWWSSEGEKWIHPFFSLWKSLRLKSTHLIYSMYDSEFDVTDNKRYILSAEPRSGCHNLLHRYHVGIIFQGLNDYSNDFILNLLFKFTALKPSFHHGAVLQHRHELTLWWLSKLKIERGRKGAAWKGKTASIKIKTQGNLQIVGTFCVESGCGAGASVSETRVPRHL